MASFVGSSLSAVWTGAAATITVTGDYRSFTYTPSVEYYDETAGADTARQRIQGFKDGQAVLSGLVQAGSLPAWGSAFVEGSLGTLVWYPEGNSAGKYVATAAFRSGGLVVNNAYNALTEYSITLTQNGARSEGTA